ncbi:outer membrane beta-barrel protein [Mesorhizobium amorphae]
MRGPLNEQVGTQNQPGGLPPAGQLGANGLPPLNRAPGTLPQTIAPAEGIPNPAYQPASPGALPDDANALGGAPIGGTGRLGTTGNPAQVGTAGQNEPIAAQAVDPFADQAVPAPRRRAGVAAGRPPANPNLQGATATQRGRNGATTVQDGDQANPATTRRNTPRRPGTAAAAAEADQGVDRVVRTGTIDSVDRTPLDPRVPRTGAIQGGAVRRDDTPYAPLGIKVGSFTLRPSLEQGVLATSNANNSASGRSATISQSTLRLNAVSDWATNSATVDGNFNYQKSFSGQDLKEWRGNLQGTLNVDLDHDWRAIARLGFDTAPEGATSPEGVPGAITQPQRKTFNGSLALHKDVGKLRLGLTGAAERSIFGDATLGDGTIQSQETRNSTLYTTTLRGGYQISPALTPFAEVEIGRRAFDETVDLSGYERSSRRLGVRGGVELDMGEKLNGEMSVGWLRQTFDDSRLLAVSGATVAADLRWSPVRGTIVGFNGQTVLEDTTTPGQSGSVLYNSTITLQREMRANLTGNAALGLSYRDYKGTGDHDLIYSAQVGATWWLNRYLGLTSYVRHERLNSSIDGRDSKTNSVYLGLTVQR